VWGAKIHPALRLPLKVRRVPPCGFKQSLVPVTRRSMVQAIFWRTIRPAVSRVNVGWPLGVRWFSPFVDQST